jgi:hypothetical protein
MAVNIVSMKKSLYNPGKVERWWTKAKVKALGLINKER